VDEDVGCEGRREEDGGRSLVKGKGEQSTGRKLSEKRGKMEKD
jgi:hypothetical protein